MKWHLLIVSLLLFVLNSTASAQQKSLLLKPEQFRHYVEYFNNMEEENIRQAIPNDSAWPWMKENIPLFECPQQNFEEMFYFRWWTLRKHIKKTEQGYVFTEFLVPRNYADKYNLIASALGHHIYESRWLHDKKSMDDDLHIWYRGNEGKAMSKLRFYSSWNIDAIYNRYLVNSDDKFITDLFPDLQADFAAWEQAKKLPDGLFWQYDVRDAMEETISGGRNEKNARPSINGYTYGNAIALAKIASMGSVMQQPDQEKSKRQADSIKLEMQNRLWNSR